jgi:hypothetical protein
MRGKLSLNSVNTSLAAPAAVSLFFCGAEASAFRASRTSAKEIVTDYQP